MAHKVNVTLPSRDLGRADAIFDVKRSGKGLGALHVSRGSVVWFPVGTSWGHKMGWVEFGELMKDHGTRTEKR
jgi:hypothetical protein